MSFASSELVLTDKGKVYHLDLLPEEISHKIILVGDQDRVPLVSKYFDSIEVKSQKREFVCHTGTYQGKRLSVVSTGIGTDNIDIVLNELDILVNYNLEKRTVKPMLSKIEFIRIGTCGVLHADIPVGSYILTKGAVGMDNVPHFYQINYTENELNTKKALYEAVRFPENLSPYYVDASEKLCEKMENHPKVVKGLTTTATGFYGPQGRELRTPIQHKNLNDRLAHFSYQGNKIINLEMETSSILVLSKLLGHDATTICLALANRSSGDFLNNYASQMDELIRYVLSQF